MLLLCFYCFFLFLLSLNYKEMAKQLENTWMKAANVSQVFLKERRHLLLFSLICDRTCQLMQITLKYITVLNL